MSKVRGKPIELPPPLPPPRQGFGMVPVSMDGEDCLFIFGGRTQNEDRKRKYLNDSWLFSIPSPSWRSLSITNEPSPRHNFSLSVFTSSDGDHQVFLFGGQLENNSYSNELFSLTFPSSSSTSSSPPLSWTKITSPRSLSPSARHGHASVVHDGSLYVFGGRDGRNPAHFCNDLWKFDIKKQQWREIPTIHPPSPRYYVSMTVSLSPEPCLVVIGGFWWDGTEHYHDDCFSLPLTPSSSSSSSPQSWRPLNFKGDFPSARNRSSFVAISPGVLCCYGGNYFNGHQDIFYNHVFLFNIEQMTSLRCSQSGYVPLRGHHEVVMVGKRMYSFGGECKGERKNDMWVMDFDDES